MGRSFSPILNNAVLLVSFGALLGAAWAGYSALVVLLGLTLAAGLVTKLWSRLCLRAVTCERRLSESRVFPGDEVTLTLRVVNRKLLPLPWVEIRDEMPAPLVASRAPQPGPSDGPAASPHQAVAAGAPERPGFVAVSRSIPLPWYSAASFNERLDSSARGYYPLGPLTVTSGDIFGLHPRSQRHPHLDHLIVYPRTFPLTELSIPSLSHLGDVRSDLRVFDDPSRLMGVREYAPGDSLRRIHWKASARSQALQVKLFEATTDLKVAVFLAIDTFEGLSPEEFELGVSTAASVARHLVERDVQTGLFANTKSADTGSAASIAAGSGAAHLAAILEALAKTTGEADGSFVDFFEHRRGDLGFGGTLVFVVGKVSPAIAMLLADLVRTGRRVLGFRVGQDDPARDPADSPESLAPGVRWHTVHPPARTERTQDGGDTAGAEPGSPAEAAFAAPGAAPERVPRAS